MSEDLRISVQQPCIAISSSSLDIGSENKVFELNCFLPKTGLAAASPSAASELLLTRVTSRSEPLLVGETAPRPTPIIGGEVFRRSEPILLPLNTSALSTSSETTAPQALPSLAGSPPPNTSLVSFTNLSFSGNEGASGTVQVRLNLAQAPSAPVILTLSSSEFLVVDADNNLQNGTQTALTFTTANWHEPRTIWFMTEVDGVATNRSGDAIGYTLAGGATTSGLFEIGPVRNTYSPDLSRFNIDLDFRNDTTGFWTQARRAIAQKAADDWAVRIANEWTGLQLNTALSKIGNDGNYSSQTFNTKRYVDDLVVFVNTINTGGIAGGYGGIEYSVGGWLTSPELKSRVGQIAIDPAVGDLYLYNAVSHELGHTLGLVGLNWEGFTQQSLASPQTATFNGIHATAANGGRPIPLQSQDGPNSVTGTYDYWHPARSIPSVMSYGWLYRVTAPTAIDFAILADSGYRVYGVNTPFPPAPPTAPPPTATETRVPTVA